MKSRSRALGHSACLKSMLRTNTMQGLTLSAITASEKNNLMQDSTILLESHFKRNHFCQIILTSVQWFLTKRFLTFSISIYRENKPCPLATMFFDNRNSLNNLDRGSPKEHFCHVILNLVQWFLTTRFLNFSI